MSGLFMGLHWVTYFYSLQVSNVAIAVISLYTFPVITSILEPMILKTKFHRSHLLSGVIVVLGMYILTPEYNLNSGLFKGVCFGVLSAFCYAVRNIILKPKVNTYNQSSLMLYQMLVVSVLLMPSLYYFEIGSTLQYLPALTVLALITTVIGHTLFVKSLKHFSASSASLISSMQPLYGILLAFFFLNEQPSLQTFIGGTLIVGAVIIESIQLNRN
jgi:drug/metabolite transporter (DMT)-like permease